MWLDGGLQARSLTASLTLICQYDTSLRTRRWPSSPTLVCHHGAVLPARRWRARTKLACQPEARLIARRWPDSSMLDFKLDAGLPDRHWSTTPTLVCCGTPFLLSLFSVHPVIPFQFLPPRGAVVSFLLRSSWLKGRHSLFGRCSNIFRLLNLFARTPDFENRRRPDSSPVGQALRVFWFVCI
jgi:hypothetical protein